MTRRSMLALALPIAACAQRLPVRTRFTDKIVTLNVPFDAEGTLDTRGECCWGKQAYRDVDDRFVNVPAGHRVRITRFYGNFYGFPRGKVPEGTHAGVMAGLITKSTSAVPLVGTGGKSPFTETFGAKGCFMWVCAATGGETFHVEFDYKINGGLLDQDNILVIRQAVFLNDTGLAIHMELTGILEFEYERER